MYLENILVTIKSVVDIIIVAMIIYMILRVVKNSSKTLQIFKGILLIFFIQLLSQWFGLNTLNMMAGNVLTWGFLAIIIIFQPEIRNFLEKLGRTQIMSYSTMNLTHKEQLINNLYDATFGLALNKTGALITIERVYPLRDFIETGVKLDSNVSPELLHSIFNTSSPIHDGAVIIQGSKIACASTYYPPTNTEIGQQYGARHRAAVGISEITDSITIVVSEETGKVSIVSYGEIDQVTRSNFKEVLSHKLEADKKIEKFEEKVIDLENIEEQEAN